MIEVVSPTHKAAGRGDSCREKQEETLARDCHLVEIGLLRCGRHVVAIPEWRLESFPPFDSLWCVSRWRWSARNRYERYPRTLRRRLPRARIPLAADDPDAILDVQAALEQVYQEGRNARRIRYGEECQPRRAPDDRARSEGRIAAFRTARPDLSHG